MDAVGWSGQSSEDGQSDSIGAGSLEDSLIFLLLNSFTDRGFCSRVLTKRMGKVKFDNNF